MREEFEEFQNVENSTPPAKVTSQIFSRIRSDLNPSSLAVFTKLALIQLITGVVTLLFCPQFGIGLTSSMGLMGVLMKFGDHICMAGCGAVYLGISGFSAAFVLRPEEIRVIENNVLIQFSTLSLLTAGVFICLGASVLTTLGLAWLFGAIVGSISTFKVAEKLRFQSSL